MMGTSRSVNGANGKLHRWMLAPIVSAGVVAAAWSPASARDAFDCAEYHCCPGGEGIAIAQNDFVGGTYTIDGTKPSTCFWLSDAATGQIVIAKSHVCLDLRGKTLTGGGL